MHFVLFLGATIYHLSMPIFSEIEMEAHLVDLLIDSMDVCAMRALWQLLDWIGLDYRKGCRRPDADAGVC